MDSASAQALLHANLCANAALLLGAVWCIAFPSRRIYPMARRDGWYFAMWALFGFVFITNPAFVLLDWNSGNLLTRNPQYVGDFLLFTGMAVIANSEVVGVTHLLTALVLLLAPFAEEPWLENEYGDPYVAYRQSVPRYL